MPTTGALFPFPSCIPSQGIWTMEGEQLGSGKERIPGVAANFDA